LVWDATGAVRRACAGRARRAVLVADQSKLRRAAPIRIASLADLDAVFTDAPLPAPLARACEGWGTDIVVANDRGADGPDALQQVRRTKSGDKQK